MHDRGMSVECVDISDTMLSAARSKNPAITWSHGDATALPYDDGTFDGAVCILATHHITDLPRAFAEAHRVIRNGPLVIFTSTPKQMRGYWLWEYFPAMMEHAGSLMLDFPDLSSMLQEAGFPNVREDSYTVTSDLQDWFLYACKHRPELYLQEHVRAGSSSFHVSADAGEIESGLKKLAQDIESGRIDDVIKEFDNDGGDYCFVVAEK